MELISKKDQNAKVILIITNSTYQQVKELLEKCWKQYSMLNIVVVHTIKKLIQDDQEYLLPEFEEEDFKFEMNIIDPFKITDGVRGHVYRFPMLQKVFLTKTILDILDYRLKNVRKYPLRICIFEYNGTALVQERVNGTPIRYMGMDGDIIHTLVQKMNFTPIYFAPRSGIRFGTIQENGTYTGSLAEVESGDADILANLRPILDYGQKNAEFLTHVDDEQFAFLTPKIQPANAVTFFDIFNIDVYALLCLSFLLVEATWLWLQNIKRRLAKINHKDAGAVFMLIFGGSMLVSQPKIKLNFQRCLYIFWTFFSLINGFIYCATMVEHLTSGTISMDIDSVENLAQTDLTVLVFKSLQVLLKDIALAEGTPDYYKILYSRQVAITNIEEGIRRVAIERDSTLLCPLLAAQTQKITSVHGSKIHILPHGIPSRYSAHLVPILSPYAQSFNEILMKIRESGLMPKWKDDVFYKINAILERNFESDNLQGVYSMRELDFLFWCWFGCCCVACLIFAGELYIYYFSKKVKFKWTFNIKKR